MDIRKILDNGPLFFDGAMGTMLMAGGLTPGELPEELNITHPEVITDIHRDYLDAGADVITANTFQANEFKLARSSYSPEELITAGLRAARAAGAKYAALDVGPLGQLMEPSGTLTFERGYEAFKRQMVAGEAAGADLILIETVADLYEAKAAVLAAKENTSLPVFCLLTFQENGRTFLGNDPACAALTLSSLGVDALGVNCSLGPEALLPVVDKLLEYSRVPVMVQANAGLPSAVDGKNIYAIQPDEYAAVIAEMARRGARIFGGCCGTSPEYISAVRSAVSGVTPAQPVPRRETVCCSGRNVVVIGGGLTVIGERINPAGKAGLEADIRDGGVDEIIDEAVEQTDAGADILDINVALYGIDEPAMLAKAVKAVQSVSFLPVQADSSDPAALEAAVRVCNGRPVVNSVNGKRESLAAVLPIVKKYGALVVGLTMDENGVPATAEERLEIAGKIVRACENHGIPREDILIDCLALTMSANREQVMETIKAIRLVKAELGVKTILGISNISHGLPERDSMNAIFLAAAAGAGLDAAILDPLSERCREVTGFFNLTDI